MASIIKLKRSTSAAAKPSGSSLAAGELAVNLADLKIYSSTNGIDIIQLSENALGNTNSYIATKVNTTTFNSALANTNSYIASVQSDVDANEATERAALANTNSYIASVSLTGQQNLANTNARIDSITTSFTLSGDSGTDTFTTGGTLNFTGTANEITTAVTNDTVTFSLPDNVTIGQDLTVTEDLAVSGNTTITGNLIVNGTTTTVTSSTVSVNDSLLKLGANNSADSVDLGWYGEYVASGTKYAGVFRDASATDDPFIFWKDLTSEPTTTANFGSGSLATVEAVIDGGTY